MAHMTLYETPAKWRACARIKQLRHSRCYQHALPKAACTQPTTLHYRPINHSLEACCYDLLWIIMYIHTEIHHYRSLAVGSANTHSWMQRH